MELLLDSMNRALHDLGEREPKSLMELQVKLSEEVGELAAALLHSEGLKKLEVPNARDHVLEEACDVIIMSLSILSRFKLNIEDVEKKMQEKMGKWERQIEESERQ